MQYKILIIDDDKELLKMLRRYFERKEYEIITAENGTEGLSKINLQPDIILLDINMPKMDGIEVCRRIRDKVACPILFLTARVEEQDVVNGLLSGGDDYILKPFSLKELDARITAHLKREGRRKNRINCCFQGEVSIDYEAKTVQIHTDYLELTKLEYAIIEFLSMNPGMVFDKERIYEKVCGFDAEGDSRVITELIRRIRNKFQKYTNTEYIETVWGDGIPVDKIRNLSVRKTIFFYMAVALFCSFLLSVAIVGIATRTQKRIWWNYVDQEAYFQAVEKEASDYITEIPRPSVYEMTRSDYFVSELCDFLQTYTILILSIMGSCAAVFLFYQNKLKKPIAELVLASKKIAGNHLDFRITYENKDEIGMLCREFERMREQLARNNQILWKNMEEEKILRAAIAHDIRSPLSVLKGYQEMLMEYLPNAEIDREQAVEMLKESGRQIERMDAFVETMRKLNSLENRELAAGEISAKQLEKDIQAELTVLEKEHGKQAVLQIQASNETFCGDKEVILEVTENLLSNAFRYAECQVEVMAKVGYSELNIYVRDDGDGFQGEKEKIVTAFYQQNIKDSLKHAGIGMYISRLYCEKHGGNLILENDEQGGAVVTAVFRRIA